MVATLAFALAVSFVLAAPARAELVVVFVPTLGVGITDNADPVPGQPKQGDVFATASATVAARYERALSSHTLGYAIAYGKPIFGHGPSTLSNSITWASTFKPTATLDVGGGALAGINRTTRIDVIDFTGATPQGTVAGSTETLLLGANQHLAYQPNAKRNYTEALGISRVQFLDPPPGQELTTFFVNGNVRGTMLDGLNAYFLDVQGGDSFAQNAVPLPEARFGDGHTLLARIQVGWMRELSATWTASAQAGPISMFRVSGPAIIAPSAIVSADYRRLPWFLTFRVSQDAAANLFIGQATLNDQVLARLALPLTRTDSVFVTGIASYIYARVADNRGQLGRAFDQWSGGVSINYRPLMLPLAAAVQYTIIDQHGGTVAGTPVPDLVRQVLLITVGGVLTFGPGTPPLFGGGV